MKSTLCVILLATIASFASAQVDESIVLATDKIGPMRLAPGGVVSVDILKRSFPSGRIKHEIRSGDSPDFHYFEIAAANGEVLFSVKSFLKEGERGNLDLNVGVRIDLLQVQSPRVKDIYGVRVGDRVSDIVRLRGSSLEFGAGHHDVYMGRDRIFYNISTGSEFSPEKLTIADAKRGNWKVVSISWPTGAWE